MSVRMILVILVDLLVVGYASCSQVAAANQNPSQTPSEIARSLVDSGTLIQLPVKGKVKHSLKKDAPSLSMPGGPSTVVLLQMPDYVAPYDFEIRSLQTGFGRTRELFVPSGIYFDKGLQQLTQWGEERLEVGRGMDVVMRVTFGEPGRDMRYLLLYTRGEWVGQPLQLRHTIAIKAMPQDAFGSLLLGVLGFGRIERSLQGKIQVETKPVRKHR